MTPVTASPATLCDAFQRTAAAHPHAIALSTPDGSTRLTWRQYAERVRLLAGALAALGVRPGDTVGLVLTNRPEFHLLDTAALHAGATPFSVYVTFAPEQMSHVLTNAGARVVVCEEQFLPALRAAVDGGRTAVEHIVCLPAGDDVPQGTLPYDRLLETGDDGFDFDATWQAVRPDDVLTIIYTSGTTGPSKGVELTHAGMLFELAGTTSINPAGPSDSVISYLPDAHIANRWGAHYTSMLTGLQIITLADLKQLITALPTVRPTLFGAVPQIWYKLKTGIEAQLAAESSPVKRRLAAWAIGTGRQVARLRSDGAPVPRALAAQHALAERLVLSTVRAKLGLDRVTFCATGAAAIDPDALEFVLGLGLPVCEMWGMSETTCVVTVNRPGAVRIGTVGQALPGIDLRIADDGELLVRGPLVMKGYRNEPELTAEAVDADGWLHTGDVATIDDDGYVRIVDRKKELMINSSGKNMSPANIEGALKVGSPLIGSAVAIGDDRPYVVALLTLDPDAAAAFAAQHGLDAATLHDDPALRSALEDGVKAANERLARVEQIKKFAVLPGVWEPGGDELTPTLKIKRKPVAAKYADRIDALYRG